VEYHQKIGKDHSDSKIQGDVIWDIKSVVLTIFHFENIHSPIISLSDHIHQNHSCNCVFYSTF
jgi:hypothetical protein